MKYLIFDNTNDVLLYGPFDSESDATSFQFYDASKCTVVSTEDQDIIDKASDPRYTITYVEDTINVSTDNYNTNIDRETFHLIKEWCKTQPEGCEEAFINIGITDINDVRYQAYITEKDSIKASQSAKKIS